MSSCERVRPWLNALVDHELSISQSLEAEKHIHSCAACRQEWESLSGLDTQLARVLFVPDVELKCAEILRQARSSTHRRKVDRHPWRDTSIAIAVAATLLLALLPMFLESQKQPIAEWKPTSVARLVRSTGPVQLLQPGANDWSEVLADGQESFPSGSRLKTKVGVLCEFQTSSKGIIRLNESAEVVLIGTNQFELVSGQLWCLAAESMNIGLEIPMESPQSPLKLSFGCPSSTEIQCVVGNSSASCDSLSPDNSNATITMGALSCSVAPGESVSIDREQKIDRKMQTDSPIKIWQLPLLAIGTDVDKELVSILDRLLSPIGMTKARNMNEEQIRMLGPTGAIPLLAYAAAESSPEHLRLRRTAMRIASELADERGVRWLNQLSSDQDEYIARTAKETLARIVLTKGK